MSATKFTEPNRAAITMAIAQGATLKEASAGCGVGLKTLKNWISKGRGEEDGPFHDFANAIELARRQAAASVEPLTQEELRLVVSKAARRGSVQAMKLYWEMTRGDDDEGKEEPQDGFEALDDELAKKRAAKV